MTTLLILAGLAVLAWSVYLIYDSFDHGPVNGAADLPTSRIQNNLDWAENEYKWDVRPPITEDVLSFDLNDPEFVSRIRNGIKKGAYGDPHTNPVSG